MIRSRLGPSDRSGATTTGVLLALAIVAAGCGGAEAPRCPAAAPLAVDLDAWAEASQRLSRAPAGEGAEALLAEAGLPPIPRPAADGPTEDHAMTLAWMQIIPLRRGGGEPLDQLVAVRFRDAAGAESLRAQLLRPVPGRRHLYCPLGEELSHDRSEFEEPCLEPGGDAGRSLQVQALVAPERDAIIARDAGGWCGPGANRGDRLVTSYWGVEGDRLVRYLELVTFEAWYESPAPPSEIRRGEITLSDDWPRTITWTETVECPPPDALAVAENGCRPAERVIQYRYTDGRYSAIAGPAAAATSAPDGTRGNER